MLEALRHHAAVWSHALRREAALAGRPRRNDDEIAFLPAALEILETPPSPLGRGIAWTIIGLFATALIWSCLGEIDVHATVQGRVIPAGRVKTVQPIDTATIKAVLVREGERVAAGQVLVELDPTTAVADVERLSRELAEARVTAARLTAQLAEAPDQAYAPPADVPKTLAEMHRHWLATKIAEHRAQVAALARERAQRLAELDVAHATVRQLDGSVNLLAQQVSARRELMDKGYAAKLTVLEVERTHHERREELAGARHRVVQASEALAGAEQRLRQAVEQFRAETLGGLTEAERSAQSLAQELVKAERRHSLSTLTAPVAGTVQQLAVTTVGGVVTPAQALLVVVPDDAELEVEAYLANRDAGFVREGQPVEVKVETFPFTRYGTLPGRIRHVSRDAVQPQDIAKDRANDSQSTPPGPVYVVRAALDQTRLRVDGRDEQVTSGMAVVAEVKVARRRIIDYLLSPLLRYRDEGLRER